MKRQSMAIVCALLAFALAQADPPPFGTVVQRWSLRMSGSYAGAGITWVRDSGRLFLMDQGYAGPCRVWKLDPADPQGTIESVPWTFANLGDSTVDIPWSIAWDNDSGCFWISQILDNNVYGGCYLLRHVWSGSRWVWGGTARDSWRIDSGSVHLFWVAGMEKHPVDGAYYGHVYSPVQDTFGLGRFDPYTKSVLGLLLNGAGLRERGLTLVPWDSCYILTNSWNADGYRKRDSTGLLLQSAQAAYGPSDWALYVPSMIKPEDTVCTYCINSHSNNYFERVSVGMLWSQLPSAFEHSVRPLYILEPSGVVDSGEVITPTLVVYNSSDEPAWDVSVQLLVDNERDSVVYHDSTCVTIPAHGSDTVRFTPWTPLHRDSATAIAWTYWQGDSVRWDDTLAQRFLVRVQKILIIPTFPLPGCTLDPGPCYPQSEVHNLGNLTMTFPLVFNIGPYYDTVWVVNLLAGGSRTVTALNPWSATPGLWWCRVRAGRYEIIYWIYVRGTIGKDVACEEIMVPSGIMDTLPFTPQARYANYGTSGVTCTTYCWIEDTATDVVVYSDSAPVLLMVGDTLTAAYRPCTLKVEGPYMVACSIHLAADQNWLNNAIHQDFRVGPGVGIEREPKLKPKGVAPEPTVVRGILAIPLAASPMQQATLHDPTGRSVMVLSQGGNDISHLAPGIYYLHMTAGDFVARRKLVKLK
ncbi:MAG: T9SS type A sorting domain-containing protein [candidate division WOR-3 bacterium]|nr:MAG: T9SS type A sorting domain-containing protein [candidate division WOR-3 bacterium]